MSRMKTFAEYLIIIILFFVFSNIVSDLMIKSSYYDFKQNVNIAKSEDGLSIEVTEASANRRQGIFKGKVTNTSDKTIPLKYIRIRAYEDDTFLQTKYVKIENIEPSQTKEFEVVFSADDINRYEVDYLDEMPDDKTFLDNLLDNIKHYLKNGGEAISKGIKNNDFNIPDWATITAIFIVFYYFI